MSERPTGRELRLVNSVVDLLIALDPEWAPGTTVDDWLRLKLDDLDQACAAYKGHMLKPEMKRHTRIPVRIVRAL